MQELGDVEALSSFAYHGEITLSVHKKLDIQNTAPFISTRAPNRAPEHVSHTRTPGRAEPDCSTAGAVRNKQCLSGFRVTSVTR